MNPVYGQDGIAIRFPRGLASQSNLSVERALIVDKVDDFFANRPRKNTLYVYVDWAGTAIVRLVVFETIPGGMVVEYVIGHFQFVGQDRPSLVLNPVPVK